MTTNSLPQQPSVSRGQSYLLLAAAIMTFLLISMGGVVCATTSGKGCPDWPGCYGRLIPPPELGAIVEYTHRLIAALTTPVILAAALLSWRNSRSLRWVSRPPLAALVFVAAVIVFGALAVLRGLPPALAVADVGSALTVQVLLLAATVAAFARRANPAWPDRLAWRTPFARLTLLTVGAVFLVLVSGVLVAGEGSATRCLGWPLLVERLLLIDSQGWLQLARQVVAAVAGLLVIIEVALALRSPRQPPGIVRAATAAGILFLIEVALGALMALGGLNVYLLVIYVVVAAALWAVLVTLALLAGLEAGVSFRRE
jgi:cytochrome c oxidase assembly protein subunit 15